MRSKALKAAVVADPDATEVARLHNAFDKQLTQVRETITAYRDQLIGNDEAESSINDSHREWHTISRIERTWPRSRKLCASRRLVVRACKLTHVADELASLQSLVTELPSPLHQGLHDFAREVRTQYRTLIVITWITSILGVVLLGVFIRLFYTWMAAAARRSRLAPGGGGRVWLSNCFDDARRNVGTGRCVNDMTAWFQAIRDDLDGQVQERTKQVVRSEQLASVGFLAAGVAHEINNPLASIAMRAESLEGRFRDLLEPDNEPPESQSQLTPQDLRIIRTKRSAAKGSPSGCSTFRGWAMSSISTPICVSWRRA